MSQAAHTNPKPTHTQLATRTSPPGRFPLSRKCCEHRLASAYAEALAEQSCAGTIDFNELSSIISARRGGPDVVRTLPVEDATITYNQFIVRSPHNPAQRQRGAAPRDSAQRCRWQQHRPAQSLLRFGADRTARTLARSGWSGVAGAHAQAGSCARAAAVRAVWRPFGPAGSCLAAIRREARDVQPAGRSVLYGVHCGVLSEYSKATAADVQPAGLRRVPHGSTQCSQCEYP